MLLWFHPKGAALLDFRDAQGPEGGFKIHNVAKTNLHSKPARRKKVAHHFDDASESQKLVRMALQALQKKDRVESLRLANKTSKIRDPTLPRQPRVRSALLRQIEGRIPTLCFLETDQLVELL